MPKINDNTPYYLNCYYCGKEFKLSTAVRSLIRKGKRKHVFCSQECDKAFKRGKNNPAWRGGKKIGKGGYVYIHVPEHPFATTGGYVLEHRLVMERHIDRLLMPEEIVHHKNGKTKDNRIGNLALMCQPEHSEIHSKERIRDREGRWAS